MFYYCLLFLFISSIQTCPLKTVDSRSGCYCGIEIDGTNYIQCQPYSIEHIPEFTRSYVHDKLNLSYNFIRNLSSQSLNQLKVKKIYLQQNLIEFIDKQTFNSNLLNYLEELHLEVLNNGSLEFLCYGSWTKLRVLHLSGFNLNRFQNCLEKFSRLEKLIIQHSQIEMLSSAIFKLPNLHEVSLTKNHLEHLKFDEDLPVSSSIQIFNLSSNQLRNLSNNLVRHMTQLKILDLSQNLFETLPILNQTHSFTINLNSNLINYIHMKTPKNSYDVSFNPICTLEKSEMTPTISLHGITQLHCDCRLAYFLNENFVNISKLIETNQFLDNETKCSTPTAYQGVLLTHLTYEQLLSTCSDQLPSHCKEVTRFKLIQQYTKDILGPRTTIYSPTNAVQSKFNLEGKFSKKILHLEPKTTTVIPPELSSFRLTSFYTTYEEDNLIIHWDFDSKLSTKYLTLIKFQIVLEQQSSSNTQIVRRTSYISPHLKQYIIHHIPANKNYYICLLLTRSSFGTDKYCREIRTIITSSTILNPILSKQAFVHMLFTNRSILFGFLFGTILTTGLLLTLAFICHLRSKRQHYRRATASMFPHTHQKQQTYLCIDKNNNDDDGTYSNSIFSSTSSKSNHFRKTCRRTCFPPIPSDQSWYRRSLRQLPSAPPLPPPCCFHHHHRNTPDASICSSTTTRRITTLSSQYSNAVDKEAMTSTSIMSSASSDEPTISSPTKHVYEELGDEITILKPNPATNIFL
ncbi:unnamed protein product [Adineta ricciae]|uniref:Uncharacterized protein n=1 Tax=Adineta ricciae TaxID=249248 RepID=A0A815XZZ8_ADIRI|nr:unnamed protein product [Adineta ricciae]